MAGTSGQRVAAASAGPQVKFEGGFGGGGGNGGGFRNVSGVAGTSPQRPDAGRRRLRSGGGEDTGQATGGGSLVPTVFSAGLRSACTQREGRWHLPPPLPVEHYMGAVPQPGEAQLRQTDLPGIARVFSTC